LSCQPGGEPPARLPTLPCQRQTANRGFPGLPGLRPGPQPAAASTRAATGTADVLADRLSSSTAMATPPR
jgi:hypothetical protein